MHAVSPWISACGEVGRARGHLLAGRSMGMEHGKGHHLRRGAAADRDFLRDHSSLVVLRHSARRKGVVAIARSLGGERMGDSAAGNDTALASGASSQERGANDVW